MSSRAASAALTVLTAEMDDPAGYGRIVRGAGGEVERRINVKLLFEAEDRPGLVMEERSVVYAPDLATQLEAGGVVLNRLTPTDLRLPVRSAGPRDLFGPGVRCERRGRLHPLGSQGGRLGRPVAGVA